MYLDELDTNSPQPINIQLMQLAITPDTIGFRTG
jgi:predicted transposase YdaD